MRDERHRNARLLQLMRVDHILIKLAALCLVVLVIVQLSFLSAGFSKYLSKVDRLEGESVASEKTVVENIPVIRKNQTISIRMIDPPNSKEVFVTINGNNAGNFSNGKVKLKVFESDYIEIDARGLDNPAKFIVDSTGTNIASPLNGLVFETHRSVAIIGKIIFKQN